MPYPDPPFELTVYDKAFARVGWVGAPLALQANMRHNAVGALKFVIPSDHPTFTALRTDGARVHCKYHGETILTGPVRELTGSGPDMASTVQVTVEDDKRLLWRLLGWPNPTGAITAQGAVTAYDTKTDSAETVLRWFVSRACTRLGITVAYEPVTDGDRGDTITVAMRMHVLAERLLPAVDQAGIGFTVTQVGAGFTVGIYEPAVYPRTLSQANGTVTSWEWTKAGPDATRVIVGGSGEGTAREFRQVVATATETAWGDKVEVFRDARDTDVAAEMDARAQETLLEAAPRTGLKITLAETDNFRYRGPNGVREGDTVPIQVGPLATVTDIVREVVLDWSADQGLKVTPSVGNGGDNEPTPILFRAVKQLGAAIRDLRVK